MIRVGDLEGSEPLLKSVYMKEKNENVGLILGGVYTALDKTDLARSTYNSVVKDHPKSEEARIFCLSLMLLVRKEKKPTNFLIAAIGRLKVRRSSVILRENGD